MSIQDKWALISVTDKTQCESIAKSFVDMGIQLLSSGGTQKYLSDKGFEVKDISDFTGEPERFGGRVKTLHHKVYSSLLLRPTEEDLKQWPEGQQIVAVVCNFYPFKEKAADCKSNEELIEWIDIGGPCMVRAAAKNFSNVWIFTDPSQYETFNRLSKEERHSEDYRFSLSLSAFERVKDLDNMIVEEMSQRRAQAASGGEGWTQFPVMKYGENPHHQARF